MLSAFGPIRAHRKPRIPAENLARDRAFWSDLLAARAKSVDLPPHGGAGYGHRRFIIIRKAAWVTLYRAVSPYPQIGVFLRCSGLAGEAFFALADSRRGAIAPVLQSALEPEAKLHWGCSYHPGTIDVAAHIAAPLPWDDAAADAHVAWLLRIGAVWWASFVPLAEP